MADGGPGGEGAYAGSVGIDYPGARVVLGRTTDTYAIWEVGGGAPVRSFPLSDEGWADAWRAYRDLEGAAPGVAPGRWERGQPIPLQPMRAGQVIGGAFRMYRLHWGTLLGVVAPVMIALYALIVVLTWMTLERVVVETPFGGVPQLQTPPWVNVVTNVANVLVVQFLAAAVAKAAADAFRGTLPSIAGIYRFAFFKIFPVGWVLILTSVMLLLPFLPGFALLWLGGRFEIEALLGVAVVLFLAAVPVLVFLFVKLVFGPVTVALENLRGAAALRRSWRLSRGVGWRILGTYLLAGLIAAGVQLVVVLVATVPVFAAGGEISRAAVAVITAASGLAVTVVTPFINLVVILLYVDARLRKEGPNLEALWSGVA